MAVVYTHTLDGVVFYVGISKSDKQRPYSLNRSDEWHDFAKGRKPQVAIYYFKHRLMAERAEMLMIYKHRDTVVNVMNANYKVEPNPLGYKDGYIWCPFIPNHLR